MRRRKPVDSGAAMADGVDYLLREFKGLQTGDIGGGTVAAPSGGGPIEPTYFVAASNARPAMKAAADFVCDGVDDHIEIRAALEIAGQYAALANGRVVLSEGNFYCDRIGAESSLGIKSLVGTGRDVTVIQSQQNIDPEVELFTVLLDNYQGLRYVSDLTVYVSHTGYYGAHTVGAQTIGHSIVSERLRIVYEPSTHPYASLMSWGVQIKAWGILRDCEIASNGGGVSFVGSTDSVVMNNTIESSSVIGYGEGYGIFANGPAASTRAKIVGNNIVTSGAYAIKLMDDEAIVIGNRTDDDILIDTGADGTRIGGNTGAITDNGTNTVYLDNDALEAADVSPLTTKGDLWGYDTADNRLPVGTDAYVLTADSGETLGVKWAAAVTGGLDLATKGDLHTHGTSTDAALGVGTDTHVLTADSGEATGIKWAAASPLTTKGDLLSRDTADARLPVGTDTHVLTADSGETLGVKWAAAAGGASALNDLSDVATGGASVGDRLAFTLAGGSTITSPDSATASSTYLTNVPANAIDGDKTTTYWESSAASNVSWIWFDMGEAVTVDRITTYHICTLADHPTTMQIQGSSDASTWNTIATVNPSCATENWDFDAETWRYWRLNGTAGTRWWKLYEVEMRVLTSSWVPEAHNVFDQSDTSGAVPVMELTQADVDEDFFKFIGTSDTSVDRALVDAADFTTPGTITGWLKINIQDDQATNPITDGDYYIPFYTAPTA